MFSMIHQNGFSKNSHANEASFYLEIINSIPCPLIIVDQEFQIKEMNSLARKKIQESQPSSFLFDNFAFLKQIKNDLTTSMKSKINGKVKLTYLSDNNTQNYSVFFSPVYNNPLFLSIYLIEAPVVVSFLQKQVFHFDKLSLLGLITAGIAHEINNPLNFIAASVTPLQTHLQELVALLEKYTEIETEDDLSKKISEIKLMEEEIDLDATVSEINLLIEGLREGASRIKKIIQEIKNFSRVDDSVLIKVDIHKGIDLTLTLLSNLFKNRITILKEYAKISEVECYADKLNQVFMNLLSNAIDAIPDKGEITIKTLIEGDNVLIKIKDNGSGISKNNLPKIFTPFFTTKKIGKGTGLGLTIVDSVIKSHQGTVTLISEEGVGTEFTVSIPLKQNM